MRFSLKRIFIFFLLFFQSGILFASVSYKITFTNLDDIAILKQITDASDLVNLQNRPLRSINGLRYRAEKDLPQITKILQSLGYYDASPSVDFEEKQNYIQVTINLRPGQRYKLRSFQIYKTPCEEKENLPICKDRLEKSIKAMKNHPPIAKDILQKRYATLSELSECGYPLASIEKQEVVANYLNKDVDVSLCVDTGPLSRFGPTTMIGLQTIAPGFIQKKIIWKEGEIYRAEKIDETQERLLKTNLFSSVLISHKDTLDPAGQLPIKIHAIEAKHKSINVGVSYATVEGPGVSFEWVNRNLRGVGELLSLQADISRWMTTGIATYKKLDFLRLDQDFVSRAAAEREKIYVYLAHSYGLNNRIDRRVNKNTFFSSGLKEEYIDVEKSINDGTYFLIGLPTFLKYTTANNLLNPSKGTTLTYRPTPNVNVLHSTYFFLRQTLKWTYYLPVLKEDKLVFAWRLVLGSIIGPSISKLPMTKLFFGGSDDDLRGYRYRTVSPLKDGHPTGGKSAVYLSLEPRFKVSETIGIVPFVDLGVVTKNEYPTVFGKLYKSVGIGARYFTFFGPLRLDIGFPLDRRKFDHSFRLYASMGQTF